MSRVGAVDGVAEPPTCLCCPKPATKSRGLCAACFMAAYRRTRLGDTWDQAVEDRRWMLKRRRRIKSPVPAPSP